MEQEIKRRFADMNKRRFELFKRVEQMGLILSRESQSLGEAESAMRGQSAFAQALRGNSIARGKVHLLEMGTKLEQLKEQLRQMDSAAILFMEADRLWVRVNETTVNLRRARADLPAISLEEAKAAAHAANEELSRLRERQQQIIQEEQATKARAPAAAAEALEERIRAAESNAAAALSRGNRNAYLRAQRGVEQLSAASAVKPNRRHAAQQASRSGMPSAQLNDIRRQILDAQTWYGGLQTRVNKIELVPKLEAELETLTTQARDVSERAFATDSGSDANLLNFNGVPERELLEMPSGGGGGGGGLGGGKRIRKGKTARRRRHRSKTRRS